MVSTNGLLITFDDLKVKQEVHLWSTGTINESMPAQVMARKLELDSTRKGSYGGDGYRRYSNRKLMVT